MPFSMSQASLPVLEVGLNALSGLLDKAAAFASSKKVDPTVLVQWRLESVPELMIGGPSA